MYVYIYIYSDIHYKNKINVKYNILYIPTH